MEVEAEMEVEQAEVQAEVEEAQAEAAASKISEDQRHFNSKALRCCLPMQTINTTGHTGRSARRAEAGKVKRARSCSLRCPHLPWSALHCPGPACLCLRCLQPFGPWRMCAVPAVA